MSIIPSYELYGEYLADSRLDQVHHETIKERSSKHNWTIRTHRHRGLGQIFLFRTSGVLVSMGEVEHVTEQPAIIVIPPGLEHGFRFSENVVGDVISVRLNEMAQSIRDQFAELKTPTDAIFLKSDTASFDSVAQLVQQLGDTYAMSAANRSHIQKTLIALILLYLTNERSRRSTVAPTHARPQGHDRRIEEFCALVEENYHHAWLVSDYAERVGLSAPQLTRLCRANLSASPIDLVRQRRIFEAKRMLVYTALTIAEIAHRTGFRDAAFFSRTFKARVGYSPKAFRHDAERLQ